MELPNEWLRAPAHADAAADRFRRALTLKEPPSILSRSMASEAYIHRFVQGVGFDEDATIRFGGWRDPITVASRRLGDAPSGGAEQFSMGALTRLRVGCCCASPILRNPLARADGDSSKLLARSWSRLPVFALVPI